MPEKTKFCINCNQYKATTCFGKLKREPDGLHYYCKVCVKLKNDNTRGPKLPKKPKSFKENLFRQVKAGPVIHLSVDDYLKEKADALQKNNRATSSGQSSTNTGSENVDESIQQSNKNKH